MSDSLRIIMTVTQANPELLAELSAIPERLRAERVRMLATIGLKFMGFGPQAFLPATAVAYPSPLAEDKIHAPKPGRRAAIRFAERLKGIDQ